MFNILLVDDDSDFRNLVKKKLSVFEKRGEYKLYFACDGKESLRVLAANPIDIVLADIKMPKMDGLTLLDEIKKQQLKVKVIMISEDSDIKNIRVAMNREAFDFLIKPVDFEDLKITINKAINQIDVEQGFQDEIEKGYQKLKLAMGQIIQSVAAMEEIRDPYTAGHMKRVAELSKALAIKLHLSKDQVEGLYMSASMHDVGKICVPSEILSKPGALTLNEFDLIQDHAQAGYEILKNIEFPWPVADIVWQHHERLDGSGYPQGLKGKEILLEAQIIAVADVVESVASFRPYRPALGVKQAIKVISEGRGSYFNAQIVDSCLELLLKDDFTFTTEQVMDPHS